MLKVDELRKLQMFEIVPIIFMVLLMFLSKQHYRGMGLFRKEYIW